MINDINNLVNEISTNVSTAKQLLANAITNMGVKTYPTDPFPKMAINISNIQPYYPLLSEGIYEENDSRIAYVGNWLVNYMPEHSEGRIIYSSTIGDYAEFQFLGTGFYITQYANQFRGIANIYIDGELHKQDFYSDEVKYNSIVFVKSGLRYGKHTVRIEVSGDKNEIAKNSSICIDRICITNIPSLVLPGGTFEEDNECMYYSGKWMKRDSTNYYDGKSIMLSREVGSYAEFYFFGTSFEWHGCKEISRGMGTIYIDDVFVAKADCYSATTVYKTILYKSDVLPLGVHKVRIRVGGDKNIESTGTNIDIDRIVVI